MLHFSIIISHIRSYLLVSMMKLPHPHISFFCLCMLLSSSYASISIISPVSAEKPCDFPAIFNLGDSNSDTGGLAAAFTPPNSPYGETYFHMPAGRFSDGRLIIDFIGITLLSLHFQLIYHNALKISSTEFLLDG